MRRKRVTPLVVTEKRDADAEIENLYRAAVVVGYEVPHLDRLLVSVGGTFGLQSDLRVKINCQPQHVDYLRMQLDMPADTNLKASCEGEVCYLSRALESFDEKCATPFGCTGNELRVLHLHACAKGITNFYELFCRAGNAGTTAIYPSRLRILKEMIETQQELDAIEADLAELEEVAEGDAAKKLGTAVDSMDTSGVAETTVLDAPIAEQQQSNTATAAIMESSTQTVEEVEGEVVPDLPATLGDCAVDPETGELILSDDLLVQLGLSEEQSKRFAVTDEATATWVVEKILERQHKIEDVMISAASRVRRHVREINGLLGRFGNQLRDFAVSQLPRHKSGEKIGRLSKKTYSLEIGEIKLETTGGVSLAPGGQALLRAWGREQVGDALAELQEVRDMLCAELHKQWGGAVTLDVSVKVNATKAKALYKAGHIIPGFVHEPEHEAGSYSIAVGGKAWKLADGKKKLTDALNAVSVKGENNEEGEQDEE